MNYKYETLSIAVLIFKIDFQKKSYIAPVSFWSEGDFQQLPPLILLKSTYMKRMKLAFLFVLLVSFVSSAQEVTGTVYDDQNVPLPGASVLIKGTTTGVITDFDGKYTIEANVGDILVFSYVGFNSQEATVTGNTLDIKCK